MKIQNKKTGVIGNLVNHGFEDERIWVWLDNISKPEYRYNSLAELNEEWEDYEEPEEFWYINECGDVLKYKYDGGCSCPILEAKEIGNCFETEEEAEKAVEKLKAWKRLKDIGLEFDDWHPDVSITFSIWSTDLEKKSVQSDLDLLFRGKE